MVKKTTYLNTTNAFYRLYWILKQKYLVITNRAYCKYRYDIFTLWLPVRGLLTVGRFIHNKTCKHYLNVSIDSKTKLLLGK